MKLLFILTILTLLLIPLFTYAADPLIPECAKQGDGGICCMLRLVSNLAKIILGLVGAFALLFFVVGGFMWITSGGSADRVKKGQSLMTNTIIGIIIVIIAWLAVNFIITSFAGKPEIISTDTKWYEVCKDQKSNE